MPFPPKKKIVKSRFYVQLSSDCLIIDCSTFCLADYDLFLHSHPPHLIIGSPPLLFCLPSLLPAGPDADGEDGQVEDGDGDDTRHVHGGIIVVVGVDDGRV
jgi:hypothetical protein